MACELEVDCVVKQVFVGSQHCVIRVQEKWNAVTCSKCNAGHHTHDACFM